jgi:hypothetical protein
VRIVETDHWVCSLPDEWQAEREGDGIVIVDDDEVSTIEIATLKREEGKLDIKALRDLASDLLEQGLKPESVSLGDFSGLLFQFVEDAVAWREWYLMSQDIFLLISHGCEETNKGMDDAPVNEILSTLTLSGEGN